MPRKKRDHISSASRQPRSQVRGGGPSRPRTKFPFEATINGKPYVVKRFIGAYLILPKDEA